MSGGRVGGVDGTMEVIMPSDMSGECISSADGTTEVIMPPRYERREHRRRGRHHGGYNATQI